VIPGPDSEPDEASENLVPSLKAAPRNGVEAMMNFLDAMTGAGLCLIVGACAFLLGITLKTVRQAGGQDLRLLDPHPGARLDLYMGIVWSGMLLVQASSVLRHMQPTGTFNLSWLSLTALAGDIFVCGVFAGRLLLRREMRWSKEKRETRSHAALS
jgi:hypothetical protein